MGHEVQRAMRRSYRLNPIVAIPLLRPLVLVGFLAGIQAAELHSASLQLRGGGPTGPLLDSVVVERGLDELAIAQHANMQAKDTAKAARTQQQNYVSHLSIKHAAEDYDKIGSMVPEARAAVLETRMYAMRAKQYADHTQRVEEESRHIPEMAAENSRQAVQGWIKADARETAAEAASSPKEAAQSRSDKIAAGVAAAVEPYHLALLRNQKFAAETYNKAKTAQQSSEALQAKAKKMALEAQELQSGNFGVPAQDMMAQAHGMMSEAENLRQWSLKLYNQANTADATAGGYTAAEQQAATNAAMTAIINPPMKLPPALL